MKNKKQIIKRYIYVCKKWGKDVLKHANSKSSKIKGHVTNEEHLTGELACRLEGEMKAYEWVLDDIDIDK